MLAANIEAQELGPDAPPIYLHVCNNNPDPTQHAYIESVLKNVTGLAGYRLQTFPDNPVRAYLPLPVRLWAERLCVLLVGRHLNQINPNPPSSKQTTQGGFARFRMMQNALREFPVDHFVMIDDDIKLPPKDGLRTLLAHAKPREYNSWWGRCVHVHVFLRTDGPGRTWSSSSPAHLLTSPTTPRHPPTDRHYKPAADYYFSRLSPRDLKAGLKGQAGTKGAVTTFHYAGTGLAVLDADMVRLHYPLLEKVGVVCRMDGGLWGRGAY